jgi:hypothetical protein
MTYYEWWVGDDYRGVVDKYEMQKLAEAGDGYFIQLNNLP